MSTGMEKPLDEMTLATLVEYSVREMAKYRRKEPSDDKYCLEIFHRAIVLRDDNAWSVLRQQFGENVRLWLSSHSHREVALRYEPEQTYIDDAFRRFWQTASAKSLEFTTIASALSYLHLCLHCAIIDTLRAFARPNIEPIPEHGHSDEPQVEDHYHEDELWEIIKSILPSKKEQRVAYLYFHCNLKPREIIRYCPGEFRNEEEIYRLKRNITERIQRNVTIIRWKLDGNVFA